MSNKDILLILAAAVCNYITWTPPTPAAPKDTSVKLTLSEAIFRSVVRQANYTAKILSTAVFLAEAAVIHARNNPSSSLSKDILSLLVSRGSSADDLRVASNIHVTPLSVVGSALAIVGGLIRLSCYRTLGRLFTYELSILKEHRLVTTGLYGFVRHPSYLGYTFSLTGLCLCLMTRGSWLMETGVLNSWSGRVVVGSWHLWAWYLWLCVFSRARKEDEYLREQFGQQWIEWQKRVPYRVLPGIF
ncbi:hypothetical protein PILCRDRAFT_818656 [Piloderma croceum F 1598]|uniref:Protein-S-isoprenylcysteine O-methyltransferase n=1 Tax=Piloderma croceum (strain F 1598) TaxID=765440 RepID=A0A0C3C3X3_PILCF|nr:hypothetical protein PILCRDRAFT_818656 [Piloderma croceum F 1598]